MRRVRGLSMIVTNGRQGFKVNGKQIGAVGSKPRDRSPWRFGQSDDFPDGMMWAATTTFSPSRNAPVVYFETKDEAMNYVESWYDLFWEQCGQRIKEHKKYGSVLY